MSSDGNRTIDALRARAEAWAESDPDEDHRRTVLDLLNRVERDEASAELIDLFGGRIAFGTAGLRAPLGPGPRRMNRLVVRQTTAGLMRWLRPRPLVVIGYDARWRSEEFAAEVAAVVTGAGGRAEILPRPLPTPVLAGAVLLRRADAGVMITASHNPPGDNGYKLYLADGIQLVSPDDAEIAAAIDRVVADAAPIPMGQPAAVLDQAVVDHHLDLALAAVVSDQRQVRTVYTPMHGVGGDHLLAAMQRAGFPSPTVVEDQFRPDPAFPTVAFPNPEETGALDRALGLAGEVGADLVLANDPDADRLAVAIPARDAGQGFVVLTGDQLGVLLADHLLRHTSGPRQVATSLVSSRLLAAIAASHGVRCSVTLTGFKWVARPVLDHPDEAYVLGYEEAIGYAIGLSAAGAGVRDKDGISAALVAAEMVADALSRGETLWDRLDRLDREHGVHRTRALSIRLDGPDAAARGAELVAGLVASPPPRVGSSPLVGVEDLARPTSGLPPTAGVVLLYEDSTRVIVRPSGTEPKLKAYLEARLEPAAAADEPEALRRLDDAEAVLRIALAVA